MAYSLIADCARMKWYMRLASRFIRAMELKMRMQPCSMSALWYDVRPEGLDFVRRCREKPLPNLDLEGLAVGGGTLRFSRRRGAPSAPAVVGPALGSLIPLRLREASVRFPWLLPTEIERPRRPRFHMRPKPYHTNPTSQRASLTTK